MTRKVKCLKSSCARNWKQILFFFLPWNKEVWKFFWHDVIEVIKDLIEKILIDIHSIVYFLSFFTSKHNNYISKVFNSKAKLVPTCFNTFFSDSQQQKTHWPWKNIFQTQHNPTSQFLFNFWNSSSLFPLPSPLSSPYLSSKLLPFPPTLPSLFPTL